MMGSEETASYRIRDRDIPLNWQPGQVIAGLYHVKGITGGGMGAIYFVDHLRWGIPLAVKTPLPELVNDEASMKRFIREAETWVDLGVHPNIAACYYVRILGGLPRIFIEYLDGGSLKERIKGKRLRELAGILDIAIQVSRGMCYVHEKGIIHRDLKPANCLLTKEGIVKITDFGLVKAGDEIQEISRIRIKEVEEGSISITGSGFGTPEYMPPEQFTDAKHVDKRSDIYTFGVMLFEMLCRRRPFVMPEEMHPAAREIFYKKAHQEEIPPEPVNLRKDCPEGLSDLILRCLEKSPERRYSSFEEIEKGLLKTYEEITGKPYLRKRPNPLKLKSDALNNRAVSLLDLGREEEAERAWKEALEADPVHLATQFNYGYYQAKKGKADLYNLLATLKGLEGVHGRSPEYWYNTALIEAEIGLTDKAKY
ncbi:MAG: hypothetical protein DRG39_04595, partial [Deltaproteobacteria bacterium]